MGSCHRALSSVCLYSTVIANLLPWSAKPPKPRLRGRIHLLGVILALPAVVLLFVHAAKGTEAGAAIYGASVVGLLGTSSLYHCPTWPPRIEAILQRLDHSMIYFLIAGSYTPFCLAVGGGAQTLLVIVWVGASLGVAKSIVWADGPRIITAGLYVLIGWAAAPYLSEFQAALHPTALILLGLGGLMYTVGAVAYAKEWPNPLPLTFGHHEIFHVLVVAAVGCHYSAVWITVS